MIEDENNKKSFNKLKHFINIYFNNNLQSYFNIFGSSLALISFLLYILTTYFEEYYYIFIYIDYPIWSYFLIEFILKYYVNNNKIEYLSKIDNLLFLIFYFPPIIINLIFKTIGARIYYGICITIRFIRFINLINFLISKKLNEIDQQYSKIILTVITIILINSSLIQVFENPYRKDLRNTLSIICSHIKDNMICNSSYDDTIKNLSFNNALYFTFVSISTVGYGDITPKSTYGRVQIIIFILLIVVLIPKQTNELIDILNLQSFYKRNKFNKLKEIPHLVLCGNIELQSLNYFCEELFHPDHGNNDKAAAILQSNDPNDQMKLFLKNTNYDLLLTYLNGDPLNENDLKRICLNKSIACIIFSEKNNKNPLKIDHSNIIKAIAINKFAKENNNANIRLFVQLNKNESKKYYYTSLKSKDSNLIIIENLKMALMAKSCLCPGVISLLGNLTRSFGDQEIDRCKQNWMKEYLEGTRHEIYRTKLSNYFEGKKFSEISAIVYKLFDGIVFSLEIEINNKTILITNPGNYEVTDIIKNKIHVFIICEDKKVADQVSFFNNFNEIENNLNKEDINHKTSNNDDSYEDNSSDDESLDEINDNILNPENKNELIYLSFEKECQLKNHIILCGVNSSLYYFISFLRKNSNTIPIVIINKSYLDNNMKEKLSFFNDIYFLKGDPLNISNLLYININYANKAVIFKNMEAISDNDDEKNIDYNIIFLYKVLKYCQKNLQVIVELNNPKNIELLNHIRDKIPKPVQSFNDFQYQFENLYASGEIFLSAFIDTLTCQSYYNKHIITIINKFLLNEKIGSVVIDKICQESNLKNSKLFQISIPKEFINKTFGDLYQFLCNNHLIPLGLYRQPYLYENEFHYTFTNPSKNVKLSYRDKVFVLGHEFPDDLYQNFKNNKNIKKDILQNMEINSIVSNKANEKLDEDKKEYDFTRTFYIAKNLNKIVDSLRNDTKEVNKIIDYQNELLLEKLEEIVINK